MGHVLKGNRVRLEEPLRLSIDGMETPGRAGSCQSGTQPRVRVAQNHPEFALLEVTCACGKVIHVRCEYATAAQAPVQP